jgi:hypothetical protein
MERFIEFGETTIQFHGVVGVLILIVAASLFLLVVIKASTTKSGWGWVILLGLFALVRMWQLAGVP